jgi:hypothetical protein
VRHYKGSVNGENSKPYRDADELGADEPTEPSFDRGGVGTGRVKFDDRGNAVWEWAVSTGAFGNELSPERLQKLEHPALSIIDEPKPASETVRANPLGAKKGYDPYDSGKLGKAAAAPRKKKDLRRLGEFLKLKKQAAKNKKSED